MLLDGAIRDDAVPRPNGPVQVTFGFTRLWGPDGPIVVLEYGGPTWPVRTAMLQADVPEANRRAGARPVAMIPVDRAGN